MSGATAPVVAVVGGTGDLGFGLALQLGRAGVEVVVGSRDGARAAEAAARLRALAPDGAFAGAVNVEAVKRADAVVLAVPFASHAATLRVLAPELRTGQLVIDATVPLAPSVGGRPTRTVGVWQGSAAQQTAELVPEGVGVVAALHTVSAALLTEGGAALEQDVLVCGDAKADKLAAAQLLERIPGLRCVDCGKLEQARIVEQITALLVGINIRYKTHAGVRLTGVGRSLGAELNATVGAA